MDGGGNDNQEGIGDLVRDPLEVLEGLLREIEPAELAHVDEDLAVLDPELPSDPLSRLLRETVPLTGKLTQVTQALAEGVHEAPVGHVEDKGHFFLVHGDNHRVDISTMLDAVKPRAKYER